MLHLFQFRSWLFQRTTQRNKSRNKQSSALSPRVETLEDRLAPGDLLQFGSLTGSAKIGSLTTTSSTKSSTPPSSTGAKSGSDQQTVVSVPAVNSSTSRTTTPTTTTPPTTTPPSTNPPVIPINRPTTGGGSQSGSSTPSVSMPSAMGWITDVRDTQSNSVAGGVTRETRPFLLGYGTPNRGVNIFADGQLVGRRFANANGLWAIRLPQNLSNGQHYFSVAPVGATSVTGGASTTIDTVAPVVKLTVTSGFATRNDPAVFQVGATDAHLIPGRMFSIDVDLNRDGRFAGSNEIAYQFAPTGSNFLNLLPTGTWRMRARIHDQAGNMGISPTVFVTSDPNAGFIGSQDVRDLAGMGPWDTAVMGSAPANPGVFSSSTPYIPNQINQDELFTDNQGRVLLSLRYTQPQYRTAFKQSLQALQATVEHETPSSNMLTSYVPIAQIPALETLRHFSTATLVWRPELDTGSVTTEGDAVMKANSFRATQNVNGSGVKVGVLSDSVSKFAGGLADSVATGDLPANVQILQDGSNGDTDEGRGMLEIVHDVAPGASLAFHTANGGAAAFADGIRALAAAGSRVITDDIRYPDSPFFSGGRIGNAVDEVAAQNVVYTSAAGNIGNFGWRATWAPLTATVGGNSGTYMNFGGSPRQTFTLPNNDTLRITFGWDAAYLEGGDPAANYQVAADMAVYIVRTDNGNVVGTFDANNPNTDEAIEIINWTNTTGTANLAFAFRLKSGPAPTRLAWANNSSSATDIMALNQGAPTIRGQKLPVGSLATAATDAANPTTPETFSAQGGAMEIFFDNAGNRLSTPEIRNKPDVTAPDGVHTSFFGSPDGSGGFLFYGTSAAAPHSAAAAALILSQAPTATASQVLDHLRNTAKDMLTTGFDPTTGAGLVQLAPFSAGLNLGLDPGPLESNESSEAAVGFGVVNTTFTYNGLAIGQHLGLPDYDWFSFVVSRNSTLNVTMSNNNLEMHLYRNIGNNLLAPILVGSNVTQGQIIYIEVKGKQTSQGVFSQGTYNLQITA